MYPKTYQTSLNLLICLTGAVAGCLPGASNDDFKRFLAAAEVSGAQSIFRSLPDGLATFLRKNAEVSAEEDEAKHIDLDSSVELKSGMTFLIASQSSILNFSFR